MPSVSFNRSFVTTARVITAASLLGLAYTGAAADTLRVPSQFPTIQAGLNAAHAGDVVLVAPGSYQGSGNYDLDFVGKAVTLRGQGGPAACIIDCNGTPGTPRRGVYFHSGETSDAVLEGFTIRDGATPSGAVADTFNGAGILMNNGSSPTIRNCIIENNHAGCWGGGVTCNNSSPIIQDCIMRGNLSDDDGGGFFCWNSSFPTLINCLITGNNAPASGGGVCNFGGSITIVNCTIVGNTSNYIGGVYNYAGSITNSVIWGNSNLQMQGNAPITYSNIQGGHVGMGNINAQPLFVNAAAGNYRLLAGSPGIDAGNITAMPAGVLVDLDGNPRVRDGNGDHIPIVDMGSFEFQGLPCPADWNHDGTVSSQDFFDFISAFFALDADFNHSGTTDSQDFFDFIGAFFTPCP